MASQWDETFRTIGFCLLAGYESLLPGELVRDLRTEAAAFFALPASAKRKAHEDGIVGYLGYGDENVAATLGKKTVGADLVESLNFAGYQDETTAWRAEHAEAECPWLPAPFVAAVPERLRSAARRYWGAVTRLMQALMRVTEESLNLSPGFFDESYEKPGTLLKLAYYPAEGALETVEVGSAGGEPQQRYGAHTDYDGFTILQREDAGSCGGGLEIQMWDSDEWTSVAAPGGTLTINIGDLLARWTNDRWRATRHRVARAAPGGPERLSIVYFTGPHPDTVVHCLPSKKCSEGEPLYPPITAREHVDAKLNAAVHDAREAVLEVAQSSGHG